MKALLAAGFGCALFVALNTTGGTYVSAQEESTPPPTPTVVVNDDGVESGVNNDDNETEYDPQCDDVIYHDTEKCIGQRARQQLPTCEADEKGQIANEPCAPGRPCITFPTAEESDATNCDGEPPEPPPDPVVLAEEAFARTPWPPIDLGWALGNENKVYTGYRYSLALDAADGWNWEPISATASLRGLTVTVTATPVKVDWNLGGVNAQTNNWRDWENITCESAGSVDWFGDNGLAWQPDVYWANGGPDCLGGWFKYSSDPITITAALEWNVSWAASDGRGDPNFRTWTTDYQRGDIYVYEWQIRNTVPDDRDE